MTPEFPAVHAVVLNFNGKDFIDACLGSLERSNYPNLKICVVDNASTDGSAEWIEQNFPRVRVIHNKENLGWAGGCNVGIRIAQGEGPAFVWLVNNDVEIEPTCVTALVEFAGDHPAVGVLSPVIHFMQPRHKVWFQGGVVDRRVHEVKHCETYAQFENLPRQDRYISGCGMFVRTSVFESVGLIDERFFMYYEDADFCLRATRAGFDLAVVGSARMYHVGCGSTGGSVADNPFLAYHILLSGLRFWRKHLGFVAFHRVYCWGELGKWIFNPRFALEEGGKRPWGDSVVDALWCYLAGDGKTRDRLRAPAAFRRMMYRRPWLIAQLMSLRLS